MRKPKIKLSFQWKIRIVFCLVSVGLTSLGVYYFYVASHQTILGLLQKNLRDVGSVGAMLFDHDSRNAIKRLKTKAFEEVEFDRQVIDALPVGGTARSIPPEKVKIIQSSEDFQTILHRLKMINYASYKDAVPLLEDYEETSHEGFTLGMMGTYLMIGVDTLPPNMGMYLASSDAEATDDGWPGLPIGTLFRSFVPFSKFDHKIYIHNELITDDFYKSLSGSIPILDENNDTIAILGVDYSVGPELNKLIKLKWICVVLIVCSFILSFLLSFIISKFLNRSLNLLIEGTKNIGQGDFQTRISVPSNDEFSILAQEINNMTQNLKKITVSRDKLEIEITQRKQLQKERQKVIKDLEIALDEIKTLKGIVPICSKCKKIRDDKGYWNKLESYIEKHSEASFSHGLCPECMDELYSEEKWYIKMKKKKDVHSSVSQDHGNFCCKRPS
ncbi:HAMP domain-containing protein [Desulfobacter curvatus]|uniref:HAMP domain-containing protein n=1 Tax=Desulfobacter curvatus TaxID=2290 RepID=UPI0003750CEB|nr:HAMP domain-containing protein [Desulfobacter curvatus]